ncbi:MAG: transposase [Nitrospirota bacterium]
MGRPLRIEYPGALYHITSRGNEKKEIFLDDHDREKFLEILEDYHERYGILIHSYVLMDNHYHLILETPKGNLLKVMHGINGGYTGYFNRGHSRVGHLFQGRYKGILVEKDAYLLELSRYVHLNPMRAKIVERPELYEWSSYPAYIGKQKQKSWMEYSWVLSRFGRDKSMARRNYKEYVEEGLEGKIETPLKDLYAQVILGGKEFRENVRNMLKGQKLSDEIIEKKRFTEKRAPEEIIKEVAKTFGIKEGEVLNRGKNEEGRKIAIYLIQRYSGLSNKKIGEIFGGIHYSSISKISMRLKEQMARDKNLHRLVKRVESNVKT